MVFESETDFNQEIIDSPFESFNEEESVVSFRVKKPLVLIPHKISGTITIKSGATTPLVKQFALNVVPTKIWLLNFEKN